MRRSTFIVVLLLIIVGVICGCTYKHTVRTLDEYCAFLQGEDIGEREDAWVVAFDCEKLRDEFTRQIHERLIADNAVSYGGRGAALDAIVNHRLLGAWREGKVLHMANSAASTDLGSNGFRFWENQTREYCTASFESGDQLFCFAGMMQTLFSGVKIHGGPNATATIETVSTIRFNPCRTK